MKVLLTGASSFTGMWFAHALAAAGHHVVMPLRGASDAYSQGMRAQRVSALKDFGDIVWDCTFGGPRFLDVARTGTWDVLCHHAAHVGDYRNLNFDVAGALAENTHEFPAVLAGMAGLQAVILTGSVFEQDEGAGNPPLRAFSPYGLSKGLTAQAVRFHCEVAGLPWGKFTIPNPFGPFEEPRFGAYLLRCFLADEVAEVRTPLYIRDNIHVDLLALRYVAFVAALLAAGRPMTLNPSGYIESQGGFAQRFGREMAPRLGRECRVALGTQTEFAEPLIRINTDPGGAESAAWNEAASWDAIAEKAKQ